MIAVYLCKLLIIHRGTQYIPHSKILLVPSCIMDEKYYVTFYEHQQTTKELRAYLRCSKILFSIIFLALFVNYAVIYGVVFPTNMLGVETYQTTTQSLPTMNSPYAKISASKYSGSTDVAVQKEKIAGVIERGLSSSCCLKIHTSLLKKHH
jgi:hypothetical protein